MKKLLVVLLVFAAAGVFAQQKFALVIGNGNYTNTTKLNNPVNDANDMAVALQGLGFTVDKVLNGTQDQMVNAIMQLKRRLGASRNSYGFLFYAGHGVQSAGENFLIPVDANIPSENFLRNRTVSLQEMLGELNDAGNELNVVVLDACRDNPFSWARSGSRGLTVVANQPADSIIVFATSAGSTAADGTGRNGLFTEQLLKQLKAPGLDVKEIFDNTGAAVSQASSRKQIPAIYSQYFGKAYLGSRPANSTPTPQPAPVVQPVAPPVNPPAPVNMVRIQGGTFTMGSPANEPRRGDNEGPQRQVTVGSFYMGKYEVTQKEYQEVMGTNPSNFKGDNLPVEKVSWYDAIEYCNARSRKEGLTPAYTIDKSRKDTNNTHNLDDVKWVVTWNRNVNGYRLPTEAEWEYACRAGTTTAYNTGASITNNTGWYSDNSGSTTHPVGQKSANAWGLYDMHGNVWEWCWDWYGNYPSGAQTDPVGASSGSFRVYRGGSWFYPAVLARSAYRIGAYPNFRLFHLGFRVLRP
ncbi:MAG: SUMF1/EgtB/PvdO family nonheme iron enzyme [Treponema sp.]|nr:SUMF1/EgtB/PvdO family nonheme iron enzyme [Treponema sp.]